MGPSILIADTPAKKRYAESAVFRGRHRPRYEYKLAAAIRISAVGGLDPAKIVRLLAAHGREALPGAIKDSSKKKGGRAFRVCVCKSFADGTLRSSMIMLALH